MEDVTVIWNITTWANHKPWMTAEVRVMLKALNVTFKSGDRVALKTEPTLGYRAGKAHLCTETRGSYQHQEQGIRAITNYMVTQMSCKDDRDFLIELNCCWQV